MYNDYNIYWVTDGDHEKSSSFDELSSKKLPGVGSGGSNEMGGGIVRVGGGGGGEKDDRP